MDLDDDGWTILRSVLTWAQCDAFQLQIETELQQRCGNAIRSMGGGLVGGRNLLDRWEGWREIIENPSLASFVHTRMGGQAGLVRILYFDKPPGEGWSLSLHRDQTIAVEKHQAVNTPFSKPTLKAGVPHVVATNSLLQNMVTLRVHLDPMNDENGPLVVIPGSHESRSNAEDREAIPIRCDRGDVFAMRPLLIHGSRAAKPTTRLHRRVLHLEFAPNQELPGGYNWHRFEPV